ncbi:Uncharacterized conserved protein [Janthinobacterium sp. Marseille]|nr:oxidoreductase-like domain-containing protein [Janthinobacterium sp. Marseille]ABR91681.1 Uncharacterized conserved protein [Janthinobacterium sp. Marseille]
MAKTTDTKAPLPPVRPDNDECCHSGCEPCIFDLYELEMEKYRKALAQWELERPTRKAGKKSVPRSSGA